MTDALTVSQAAAELGTSVQTIRNYLRDDTLRGRQSPTTGAWSVRRKSIDAFLAEHGRLDGGRRRKSATSALEAEVRRLTKQVERLALTADRRRTAEPLGEPDDLRTRVFALEDALAKMRDAAELQREAEAKRSEMVSRLLEALAAADRADSLRRGALESLEDGLAGGVMPGQPGTAR